MSRTYDLFEVMPDGDLIWKATVDGHENAVHHLQQAAKRSQNEFRLMHLPSMTVIATINTKADDVESAGLDLNQASTENGPLPT